MTASMSEIDDRQMEDGGLALRALPAMMVAHYLSSAPTQPSQGGHSMHSIPEPAQTEQSAPTFLTLDDYNLVSLGYKPVLPRELRWTTLAGITITSSNVLCGIVAVYGIPLTSGGPAWATWSFLGIGLMSLIVSLCLAELVSAYPTTAGVHHWVYQLGSLQNRPFLTWIVGWITIAGSVATASSVSFYFASILGQVLNSIHRIEHTPGMLVMLHLGILSLWQLVNLLPTRGLGHMSTLSAIFAIFVTFSLVVLLLTNISIEPKHVLAPFTTVLNYSGSKSAIYASLSSCLMAAFVFCPQDNVIRLSEESLHPEQSMPWMLIGSTVFSLLIGFPLVIALNYASLVPMQGLLDEYVPAVRIILTVLGRQVGLVFMSCLLFVIFFSGMNRLSMACRVAYAFSRDGGLPKSSHWNHLHKQRRAPERVSWLVTVACMSGIFPYYWGNINAFHWIANLACVASNLSFVIPLWIRLTPEGVSHHVPGPFALRPRLSRVLHVLSIIWLLFVSIVLMFPSSIPLQARDFNYAPVALAGVLILASVAWWCKAKYGFTGGAMEKSRAVHRVPDHLREARDRSRRHSPPFLGSPRNPPPHPREAMVTPLTTIFSASDSGKLYAPRHPTQSNYSNNRYRHRQHDPSRVGNIDDSRLPSTCEALHDSSQSPCAGTVGSNECAGENDTYSYFRERSQSAITIPSYASYESPDIPGIPLSDSSEIVPRDLSNNDRTSSILESPPSVQSSTGEHNEPKDLRGDSRLSTGRFLAPSPDSLLVAYGGANRRIPEITIAPPTTASSRSSGTTPTTTSDIHFVVHDGENDGVGDRGTRRTSLGRVDPGIVSNDARLTRTNSNISSASSTSNNGSHHSRPMTVTESLFPSGINTSTETLHTDEWTRSVRMNIDKRGNRRPPTPFPVMNSDTSGDEMEAVGQESNTGLPSFPPLQLTGSAYPIPNRELQSRQRGHFSGHGWVKSSERVDNLGGPFLSTQNNEWYDLDINDDLAGSELPVGGMDPNSDADIKNRDDWYYPKGDLPQGQSRLIDVDESFDEEYNHQYPVISSRQSSHNLFKLPTMLANSTSPTVPTTVTMTMTGPRGSQITRYPYSAHDRRRV
ncbi:hypothetical protein BGW38_004233 [Lunasporangiospora selenospora]|uniref:Amino acid transporter n=1 Tax=Lunasporangiospora selenospora TaxID=979761 RepID=A0A9P6KC65_9FUNG|nr:hypothetical protein BGW38_004233 [Lunasporangiospora selenospora]